MVELLNRRLLLTDFQLNNGDTTNDSSSDSSEEANFDADMVVMLAALLCALVSALLLNSVIHVYLRRRREAMVAATNAAQQATGLEKRALKRIPVAVFKLRVSGGGSSATECTICLGEFLEGEKMRVLPECKHEFHVKCVDKWLKEHTSCPNCRRSLIPLNKVADGLSRASAGRVEQGRGIAAVLTY